MSARRTAIIMALAACVFGAAVRAAGVELVRTPNEGIQPRAAVDSRGTLHLIYYRGDAAAGDVFYVRRAPGARQFSAPLRVNSVPASAIAAGTIRGAQIALGRNGRVHVAWNGSKAAEPKGPDGALPMLYTRLNEAGDAFEPQRNVMQYAKGLDGGGTLAADAAGNVYVTWHGQGDTPGEQHRRVYVTRSSDEGHTFGREEPAWSEPTGACGCCGMAAFAAADGTLYIMYRGATEQTERGMVLLAGGLKRPFRGARLDHWTLNACPMSSESIAAARDGVLVSWEREGQIYFARVEPGGPSAKQILSAPGAGKRKHPALAVNGRGDILLAWAEGTGWKKGGSLAWQVFDAAGRPTAEKGQVEGLPAWSMPAAFVSPGGRFSIIY